MDLILRDVQYHPEPSNGPVALLIEHAFGRFFVNTFENALTARLVAPATVWGNAEALAEAQAGVDVLFPGKGYVVSLPEPPAPPAPPPTEGA